MANGSRKKTTRAGEPSKVEGTNERQETAERSALRRGRLTALVLIGLFSVSYAWMLHTKTTTGSGDPYAVYLPATTALTKSFEHSSFSPLKMGVKRVPAFPVAASLVARATGVSSFRACQLVSLLSAILVLALCYLLFEQPFGIPRALLTLVVVAGTTRFAQFSVEPMSDMFAMALALGALYLLTRQDRIRVATFAAAATLMAVGVLTRKSGWFVPGWFCVSCLLLRDWNAGLARRIALSLGFVTLTYWPGQWWWNATYHSLFGDTLGASEVPGMFNHFIVPKDVALAKLIEDVGVAPVLWRALKHLTFSGPIEVVLGSLSPPLAAAVLVGTVLLLARLNRRGATILLFFGCYLAGHALVHFEARYYLLLLPFFALAISTVVLFPLELSPVGALSKSLRWVALFAVLGLAANSVHGVRQAIGREVQDAKNYRAFAELESVIELESKEAPEGSFCAPWQTRRYSPVSYRIGRLGVVLANDELRFSRCRFYVFLEAYERNNMQVFEARYRTKYRPRYHWEKDGAVVALLERIYEEPISVRSSTAAGGLAVPSLTDGNLKDDVSRSEDAPFRIDLPHPSQVGQLWIWTGPSNEARKIRFDGEFVFESGLRRRLSQTVDLETPHSPIVIDVKEPQLVEQITIRLSPAQARLTVSEVSVYPED